MASPKVAEESSEQAPRTITYAMVAPYGALGPDYQVDSSSVLLTADASQIVQTAAGNVVLSAGLIGGDTYVLKTSGTLSTRANAVVRTAFDAETPIPIDASTINVSPTSLGVSVGATILPKTSYIIILSHSETGNGYQVITVTFSAATS